MQLYRVKDWNRRYENNRSREIKSLDWVPIPNRHDSEAYLIMVELLNGASIFGAWCSVLMLASKCNPRGSLYRENGKPHDLGSIARVTKIKDGLIEEMLGFATECDLIEVVEIPESQAGAVTPQRGAAIPQDGDASCVRVGAQVRNRTEGKGREQKPSQPSHPVALSPMDKKLLKDQLDKAEGIQKRIRETYSGHQTWSEEDKTEFRRLTPIIKDLKRQLGWKV